MQTARCFIVLSLAVSAAACGAPAPSSPTATGPAAATLPPPAIQTLAPATSLSEAPAAATPSAAAPTPAPTPTPPPTPTPTPAVLNPLTGLPLADPGMLNRRPLAIKVAHFPRGVRANQVGLSAADNVWEHYAEGGVTRFTAVFWGQAPERVGNVRSARLIDAILGDAYQAVLVASGSSTGTMNRLRANADLFPRIVAEATGYSECPLLCREASAAETTNKLYTSPPALWQLAETKGFGPPPALTGYAFAPAPAAGGDAFATLHFDFQLNNTIAEWRYDAAAGVYTRWIDAAGPDGLSLAADLALHLDAANGQTLTAANVVVLFAPYVASNIREAEGGARYFSYDILLTGEGPAEVFRDGHRVTGRWERADVPHRLPRFVDAAGNVIALKPGVTWFEVFSANSPVRADAAAGVYQVRFRAPDPFPATATPTP